VVRSHHAPAFGFRLPRLQRLRPARQLRLATGNQHVTDSLRQDAADAIDRSFPVSFLSTTKPPAEIRGLRGVGRAGIETSGLLRVEQGETVHGSPSRAGKPCLTWADSPCSSPDHRPHPGPFVSSARQRAAAEGPCYPFTPLPIDPHAGTVERERQQGDDRGSREDHEPDAR
jgi:hypothetical protein